MGPGKTFSQFFYLLLPSAWLCSPEEAAGVKFRAKKLGIGTLSSFPELPGGKGPALGAREGLGVCRHGGSQVSVPEGSVKIEVRKENLLSNGAAGAGGLGAGQPLPSRRAGGAGNPRGPPPGWN